MNAETTEHTFIRAALWFFLCLSLIEAMQSIKKSSDFKEVYRKRDLRADPFLVMYKFGNHSGESRIGISVSKRVGNSVVRHRLKRRIREIARLHSDRICAGFDLVVVLRPFSAKKVVSYWDLEASFLRLLKRHHLIIEKE